MPHYSTLLPSAIANGYTRRQDWSNEIVTTDGGYEVRNTRWSTPLRAYDIAMPNRQLTDADQQAVRDLWETTRGGVDTFEFYDEIDDENVIVRFDTPLTHQHVAGTFYSITTFTLKEVRG